MILKLCNSCRQYATAVNVITSPKLWLCLYNYIINPINAIKHHDDISYLSFSSAKHLTPRHCSALHFTSVLLVKKLGI